jgi:hypothetical protein
VKTNGGLKMSPATLTIPGQVVGQDQGPTVCENCMEGLATCLTQTIVIQATAMGKT